MPDHTRSITLGNGLHLTLRHAPRLKRAAAALRVHAGSHDAPAKFPGLAHFLEHLFFLGTARFPLENGLMRYVQGQGGQVNASTQARTTDFFFEVPPTALAGGLERLCQMLAEPDLGIERQQREREVIHAEFIAWSRNPQAQQQFALLQCVARGHPLRAFHAGNRYSLPLANPAFQQALAQFHQRFYQAGQITLSLAGPQPLGDLEELGKRFAALFTPGTRAEQQPPPPLLDGPLRQDLLFAHEHLPEQAEAAFGLLQALLTDSRPGGWLAALRQRGWLQDCTVQHLYSHAGQMLWQVQLQLTNQACRTHTQTLLRGWMSFIRQQDRHQLNNAFARLQQRREQAASALELARQDSTGLPFTGLTTQAMAAFDALMASLPAGDSRDWRLPADEPLLGTSAAPRSAPLPVGLTLNHGLPSTRQFAAVYLRWHIVSPLRARFHSLLDQALQPLRERAERASLQIHFEANGPYWQLHAAGHPQAVARAIEEALPLLRAPKPEHWQAPPKREPALIPLRALLKALPNALLGNAAQPQPACRLDQPMLDSLWQQARWQGMAIGFDETAHGSLGAALQALPGQPGAQVPARPRHGRHWQQVDTPGEPALLLFCPLPEHLQACGRLLAHVLQGPFYQRMRVELQLGYAVFSAFRQIAGQGGLLFGVQSPKASHDEILGHLATLLREGVRLDLASRQQLADQFSESAMGNADVAQWAWQAHMAAQDPDLPHMAQAIHSLEQPHLDALLQQVLQAEHGWLCLANAAAPGPQWQ